MKKTGRIRITDILLGILIGLITYLILNGLSLQLDLRKLVDSALVSIVLTSVLTFAVNRWLWKHRLVRWVLGIQIPCIEGRWEGYIKSSYDNFANQHPVAVEIYQTNLQTYLTYYDENATSGSLAVAFVIEEGASPKLMCIYRNEPLRAQGDLQIHYGSMIMLVDEATHIIDGTYFNHQQQRGTYGQIYLTLKSRKLAHTFRGSNNGK